MSDNLSPSERATARGHIHTEAYFLLTYECINCRHRERIWNGRDGTVPSRIICSSCGVLALRYMPSPMEVYAINHRPHRGQRVFIATTASRAKAMARQMVGEQVHLMTDAELVINTLAASLEKDGVDIRIEGYEEIQ